MAGNTDNNASPEHRLSVVFVFQSGLTKKHSLWYQDDEEAPTMFSKSAMPHLLAFDPGLLQDNLALVHPQIQYITLAFSANNIYLKTYWDDSIVRPGKVYHINRLALTVSSGGKPLQSNFKFSRSDFITCNVSRDDLQITVGLKELKAVLSYALETGSVLYARFDDAGGPIIFTVEEHGLVLTDIAVMSQMAEEHISQVSDSHSNNGSITSMENSFMSRLSVNQRQRPAPVAEESSPAVAPEPTTQHRRSAQPSASSGRRTQHKRPPPTSGRPSSSSSRSSRAHGPPEPAAPTPETSSLHSPSWSRVASGHDPVSDVPSDQLVSLSSSSSDHYRRIPTRPISPTQLQQDSRDDGSTTEDEDEQLFTVEPKKRRFFDSN
ncbi:hypothetical protein DM01DRAFT_1338580 [Hesseltinella vesiculosa]|uniref:Rad9-domain-containing protein n=1 Tax=Hesseltinella vesiculosa TaxID=101127 RepID=A0A1X2G9H0_9FUNG|nr:hypothetical protein DM01DRAFT_1338580 [Hesseltinella vesiculosa]